MYTSQISPLLRWTLLEQGVRMRQNDAKGGGGPVRVVCSCCPKLPCWKCLVSCDENKFETVDTMVSRSQLCTFQLSPHLWTLLRDSQLPSVDGLMPPPYSAAVLLRWDKLSATDCHSTKNIQLHLRSLHSWDPVSMVKLHLHLHCCDHYILIQVFPRGGSGVFCVLFQNDNILRSNSTKHALVHPLLCCPKKTRVGFQNTFTQ